MNAMRFSKAGLALVAIAASLGLLVAGCGDGSSSDGAGVKGAVEIDGSSTVEPISSAIAEEFQRANQNAEVTVAASGTSGGMKKFANGEIDIAGASRPIKEEEIEACKSNDIEWIEIPVAYDGLSIIVNPQNDFATDITVAELKKIWEPNSKVSLWSDVRPEWPKENIQLYGPGTDSGTFDYFTEEICGEKGASRSDYQMSEDDNVLVQGIAGDKYALGYFGYAYFEQNKDKLKVLKVDGIEPTPETVENGAYRPLSRPLYLYINKKSMEEKPAVAAFVKFYLTEGEELVSSVGYVPLPEDLYTKALEHAESKKAGASNLLPSSK